jgi:hypothetical protein
VSFPLSLFSEAFSIPLRTRNYSPLYGTQPCLLGRFVSKSRVQPPSLSVRVRSQKHWGAHAMQVFGRKQEGFLSCRRTVPRVASVQHKAQRTPGSRPSLAKSHIHNTCLLVKLIHRLHSSPALSTWAAWLRCSNAKLATIKNGKALHCG